MASEYKVPNIQDSNAEGSLADFMDVSIANKQHPDLPPTMTVREAMAQCAFVRTALENAEKLDSTIKPGILKAAIEALKPKDE